MKALDWVDIRPAKVKDCQPMADMINFYAGQGIMLPKSSNEIMTSIATYFVAVAGEEIIGICGYKIWLDGGVEIRSLVVNPAYQKAELGTLLVKRCFDEAKAKGFTRFIILTIRPKLAQRLGFKVLRKEELPAKFWTECRKCSRYPDKCEEIALELDLDEKKSL